MVIERMQNNKAGCGTEGIEIDRYGGELFVSIGDSV